MVINYKLIQPGYFNIAVTVLMAEYADKLIAGMVRKGYTVAPALAGGEVTITQENRAAALVVFTVYTGNKDATTKTVSDHLVEVTKEQGLFIYSSVIFEYCNAMFGGSNFSLPEKPQPPAIPPVPPETMRKMN